MEFERSVFRVHERFLKGPKVRSCLEKATFFFAVMTAFTLFNFVVYHWMYVSSNTVLREQIEIQLKPFFWREIERRDLESRNESTEQLDALPDEHFSKRPRISLNYTSSSAKFIFDNSTSSPNQTSAANFTNIGIRREDIFYLLILKSQKQAETLRKQKLQGEFQRLSQYKYPEVIQENLHSFYKFSGELGTVNFAHSTSVVTGGDDNLFKSDFL